MSTIKVKVENATNLKELRLQKNIEVELPENSQIEDLLLELGIERLKEKDDSISSLVMVFKNNKGVQSTNEKLGDGDKIKIMPLASGG